MLRARIYRTAEKRILEQAPLVPLYHPIDALATQSYVHGLEPGPLGISVLDLERLVKIGEIRTGREPDGMAFSKR